VGGGDAGGRGTLLHYDDVASWRLYLELMLYRKERLCGSFGTT
jgi:hypothetical protein